MAIYTIYKNGTEIFNGKNKTEPSLHLEVNAAGSLEFTDTEPIAVSDTEYKTDTYVVKEGSKVIFAGRQTEAEMQYNGLYYHYIEGAYGYFNDTLVKPFNTSDGYDTKTPSAMLSYIIACHNAFAASNRKITLGTVTVTGTLTRKWNYELCIDALADLREELGGFMVMTYSSTGAATLNWYNELPTQTGQKVELGKNILDLTKRVNTSNIISAVLPLGPTIEKTDDASKVDDLHILSTDTEHLHLVGKNLTLTNRTDVNQGKDYLQNDTLVNNFGYHFEKVDFSEAISALDLRVKAYFYMQEQIIQTLFYKCDVADLHYAKGYESDNTAIEFATSVPVVATVYEEPINTTLPVSSMDIDLDNAVKQVTLGTIEKQSLSEKLKEDNTINDNATSDLQNQVDNLKQNGVGSGGGGSNVVVMPKLDDGVEVADITVNGDMKKIYAPDYLDLAFVPCVACKLTAEKSYGEDWGGGTYVGGRIAIYDVNGNVTYVGQSTGTARNKISIVEPLHTDLVIPDPSIAWGNIWVTAPITVGFRMTIEGYGQFDMEFKAQNVNISRSYTHDTRGYYLTSYGGETLTINGSYGVIANGLGVKFVDATFLAISIPADACRFRILSPATAKNVVPLAQTQYAVVTENQMAPRQEAHDDIFSKFNQLYTPEEGGNA